MSVETMVSLPSDVEMIEIVTQVWASFLDDELLPVFADAAGSTGNRLVAWVSISGEWTGHLQVTTTPGGARDITAGMFQLEAAEVETGEVADAIGEIANMIGGTVKGMVGASAALSLPQVVLDASALISPDAHEVVQVRFQWRGEPIEVSLWERRDSNGGGQR